MWGDTTLQLLVDLLYAGKDKAGDRFKDVHTWRYERALNRGKAMVATATALITALALSYLKDEFKVSNRVVLLGVAAAAVVLISGIVQYWRAAHMDESYAPLLRLLAALGQFFPMSDLNWLTYAIVGASVFGAALALWSTFIQGTYRAKAQAKDRDRAYTVIARLNEPGAAVRTQDILREIAGIPIDLYLADEKVRGRLLEALDEGGQFGLPELDSA